MVSQVRTDYKTKGGCAKRAYGESTMGHSDGSSLSGILGEEGVGGGGGAEKTRSPLRRRQDGPLTRYKGAACRKEGK